MCEYNGLLFGMVSTSKNVFFIGRDHCIWQHWAMPLHRAAEEGHEAVVRALGERTAALVRNHGLVGIGGTALEALAICQMVERAAQIYTVAESVGGANELPAGAVETERELFRMRQAAKGDGA